MNLLIEMVGKSGGFFYKIIYWCYKKCKRLYNLNKDAIKFKYSIKKDQLKAFATEPIIIENKSLGYNLKYELQTFNYDYKKRLLNFESYPFFQEVTKMNS